MEGRGPSQGAEDFKNPEDDDDEIDEKARKASGRKLSLTALFGGKDVGEGNKTAEIHGADSPAAFMSLPLLGVKKEDIAPSKLPEDGIGDEELAPVDYDSNLAADLVENCALGATEEEPPVVAEVGYDEVDEGLSQKSVESTNEAPKSLPSIENSRQAFAANEHVARKISFDSLGRQSDLVSEGALGKVAAPDTDRKFGERPITSFEVKKKIKKEARKQQQRTEKAEKKIGNKVEELRQEVRKTSKLMKRMREEIGDSPQGWDVVFIEKVAPATAATSAENNLPLTELPEALQRRPERVASILAEQRKVETSRVQEEIRARVASPNESLEERPLRVIESEPARVGIEDQRAEKAAYGAERRGIALEIATERKRESHAAERGSAGGAASVASVINQSYGEAIKNNSLIDPSLVSGRAKRSDLYKTAVISGVGGAIMIIVFGLIAYLVIA